MVSNWRPASYGLGGNGIVEPGPESESAPGPPFLLRWLRQLWDYDWGEVHATSRALAIASASAGLFVALGVGAWIFLEGKGFLQAAADFLQAGMGVGAIVAVLFVGTLVLAVLLVSAVFGGVLIVLSSSPRSYMGYLWRGGLLMVVALAVQVLAETVG